MAALALVRASETRPESQLAVVVTDVVIVGKDGLALVRELRLMRPGLPVVLVSGYADQAPWEALISTDISYLSKPYDTAERLATVARLAGPPDARVVVPSILLFINCSCTTQQIRT
ncbi:MAG TPA: response regulator [Acetobacteraceae bacterium]|nr:response regulator [Acetobacteraceae bacterium]